MKHIYIISIIFLFYACNNDSNEEEVVININVNDFSITIDENPMFNQILGTVNATTNEGILTFSIENQSPNGAVDINTISGELKVANENVFDFETNQMISGNIKVTNSSVNEYLSFTINLNDIDETSTDEYCGIILKDIIGGTFTMGGNTSRNDSPEVTVTLSNYKISEKEITNAEYVKFLNSAYANDFLYVSINVFTHSCGIMQEYGIYGSENSPYHDKLFLQLNNFHGGCTHGFNPEYWNINNKSWIAFDPSSNSFSLLDNTKSDWPVNWVSWYGASAFAQFCDMSLPTEAQWEYAARGGQQLDYPTVDGSISSERANYNGQIPDVYDPNIHIVAVGQFPPNAYGLYDMGGNVYEYCQDYYSDSFYTNGTTDPVNSTPESDSYIVIRGGSFNTHAETLLTYYRQSFKLSYIGHNYFYDGNSMGFRVVKN